MRRIAIVATPPREADPRGAHGSLDGDAFGARLAAPDARFEVHELDPSRDLAEQIEEIFDEILGDGLAGDGTRADTTVDAIFYASTPVVLAPDQELFLCLDPGEVETGDALAELAEVFTERARGSRLFVLDCRYPPSDDPLQGVACMEAIQRALRGRAEVLAAARVSVPDEEGALSPLTRALLGAVDEADGDTGLSAKAAHQRIVDEAQVAGEVRALAYLSHGDSMVLVPSSASEGASGASPSSHPVDVPTEEDPPLPPSAPSPASIRATSAPSGDTRPRSLAMRIGGEARARALLHREAARDLVRAGMIAAALDELRRGAQVAPAEERVEIAVERARVAALLGDAVGLAAVDDALLVRPGDVELLGLRVTMMSRGDADPSVRREAEEAWLAAIGSEDEVAAALLVLARAAVARSDDARAIELLDRARGLAAAPDEVLVELRQIASRAGDLRNVARWSKRIAERTPSPRAKARLLREAAAAHESTGARDDAAAALEAALLADPTQLGALDALSRLLGASERWSYLAAMYRRLADRCLTSDSESISRAARAAILARLGGVLRDRLRDARGALVAFEDALREVPRDASLHLAAFLVALDVGDADAAISHVEPAAQAGHLDLELVTRLRELLVEAGRPSAAERAAIVAEALGASDEAILAAAAAATPPGAPASPFGLTGTEAWIGEDVEPALEGFLQVVAPAAVAARLEQLTRGGSLPEIDVGVEDGGGAATRAVALAARILGMAEPRLVVVRGGREPFRAPPAGEPLLVISQDATDGLPPRELAFLAARAVAQFWGAHQLASHYAVTDEIESLVLGAALAAVPDVTLPGAWADAAVANRAAIEPWLGEEELARLATVANELAGADVPIDGTSWLRAVVRRLDRAALLLCGDVHAAVAVIAREDGDGERLDDLLGFYLSTKYERVLREVGGSMLPPAPPTEADPGD